MLTIVRINRPFFIQFSFYNYLFMVYELPAITQLPFTRYAIMVTVHIGARAIISVKSGFFKGSHLGTMGFATAAKPGSTTGREDSNSDITALCSGMPRVLFLLLTSGRLICVMQFLQI